MEKRDTIIQSIIRAALHEDLSDSGDVTSLSIFGDDDQAEAIIRSKEIGVLSGISLIKPVFAAIDSRVTCEIFKNDGDAIGISEEICRVKGPIIAVLSGERLILNLLQRMSAVATATNILVKKIAHTNAHLLDTRKTTPNLRLLEKEAVSHGGGVNHRFGLFDMIMAKDTHVKAAGGPDKAVLKAKEWCKKSKKELKIEVEVESLEQFEKALPTLPTRIMLDNMSVADMTKAVAMRNSDAPEVELEASGNVTIDTISAIAETGVDFISVGAITHSVKALDIHLILV